MSEWEVYAVKYAEQTERRRYDNFIFDDHFDERQPIDFFVWVLRAGDRVVLVDTGYDSAEAEERGRSVIQHPDVALAPLGLTAEAIDEVVVTHLHFDHAGGLHLFPNARLHLQAAEMAFATGPCMCHDVLKMPFTAGHVCEAVRRLYAGQVIFHEGDAQIADGVTLHRVGGHSRGLQAVRVRTRVGWMVLASDAAHFYDNFWLKTPFPIVVDLEDMLTGFDTLERLATRKDLVIPGHDPKVGTLFPPGPAAHITRLDPGPTGPVFP